MHNRPQASFSIQLAHQILSSPSTTITTSKSLDPTTTTTITLIITFPKVCLTRFSLSINLSSHQQKSVHPYSQPHPTLIMPKATVLWSHPRSVSTAFERAFINRDDVRCFHEPFGEPFYYGPDRMSKRYNQEQCTSSGQAKSTFNAIYDEITTAAATGDRFVFVKDMSQYIVKPSFVRDGSDASKKSNPTVFTDDQLRNLNHSFLIRTPEKSVPSYYRCCIGDKAKETGFDSYDPEEAGYVESVVLYDYLVSIGITPAVVDSADLVASPVQVMTRYCESVAIPYKEGMVEWKAERVESFDKWKGFHDDAQQSTGFKEIKHDTEQEECWPAIVKDTIKENLPPYEYLRERRIKV